MQNPCDFLFDHHHEQLVYRYDQAAGLRALIAVHNTTLGPALGGTRLWQYDAIEDAIVDVLRLSEGMTYKAAVAGLPLGGGKAVIMADGQEKNPLIRAERFRLFGRFVNELGGRYITAEDVGTKPGDMHHIRQETRHVVGMPREEGGSGDPSPVTAWGIFNGMRALIEDVMDTDDFTGIRVSLQGLGKVGRSLAQHLLEAGATVTGTDINPESIQAAKQIGVEIVEPDVIYDVPCDIFSPNALGAVINDDTIPRLTCKIIAGGANNQLEELWHGEVLHEQGIVYAVDYVINAGGLINVAHEIDGYNEAKARAKAADIYHTIRRMLEISRMEHVSPVKAAQMMADDALHRIPAL